MLLLFFSFFSFLFPGPPSDEAIPESIYDFKVEGLTGGVIDFSAFKGKKILIVNTASRCGLTPQYEMLENLYKNHQECLVIVGFPANNFLDQEPGSNEEISAFCQQNYGITFPMAAKISVKGKEMAPIYQWLTKKVHNGYKDSAISWNFQKYLIDETGQLIAIYPPKTNPEELGHEVSCHQHNKH